LKVLSQDQLEYLAKARVARIATSDLQGNQNLIPIVFANSDESIYFVIDKKAKRPGKTLRRLQNIAENPSVRFLIDHYSENWSKLSYLLLECEAGILASEDEKEFASVLLKKKYNEYRTGGYYPEKGQEAIIVKLQPRKAVFWQNLHPSLS